MILIQKFLQISKTVNILAFIKMYKTKSNKIRFIWMITKRSYIYNIPFFIRHILWIINLNCFM